MLNFLRIYHEFIYLSLIPLNLSLKRKNNLKIWFPIQIRILSKRLTDFCNKYVVSSTNKQLEKKQGEGKML